VGPIGSDGIAQALGLPPALVDEGLARLEADGQVLRVYGDRWCERRILQRIHRRTLGALREQIRPVTPAELIRFVLRWQHVAPGTRLHGVDGLLNVIAQLEGFELPPAAWEREVLPARIEAYDPAWLDELCLSGEVAWARLRVTPPAPAESPTEPSSGWMDERGRSRGASGKVGLFLRTHASWLVDNAADSPTTWAHLSPLQRRVAEVLERGGAAFAADLAARLGESLGAIEDALWELVRTGAVTADGFSGLRALISPRETRPRRALQGRWSLLHRDARPPDPEGGELGDGSPVEQARLYLRRYGVVMRALLARESAAPPWRDLVQVYRRLEARGEIRGGRFVSGLSGEQFALPEAVEGLRGMRRRADAPEEVAVPAVDPLNLVGIVTPGPRVPAVPGHAVVYRDGAPVSASRPLRSASAGG
jgi:ATP-dependent Lhr-like helicase